MSNVLKPLKESKFKYGSYCGEITGQSFLFVLQENIWRTFIFISSYDTESDHCLMWTCICICFRRSIDSNIQMLKMILDIRWIYWTTFNYFFFTLNNFLTAYTPFCNWLKHLNELLLNKITWVWDSYIVDDCYWKVKTHWDACYR